MNSLKYACVVSLFAVGLTAHASLFTFGVKLEGAQEAPGPGDPDGTGFAFLVFDDVASSVAWNIIVHNIEPPVAAHIHLGDAGVAGPVRIDFSGLLSGTTVDPDVPLVLADPTAWYVNVHTASFRAGAIRGQIPANPVPEGTTAATNLGLASFAIGGLALIRRSIRRR